MNEPYQVGLLIFAGVFGYALVGTIFCAACAKATRYAFPPNFLFWPLMMPIAFLIVVYCKITGRPYKELLP